MFERALKYLNKNFDYLGLCCSSSREHNSGYLINEYWLNEQRTMQGGNCEARSEHNELFS